MLNNIIKHLDKSIASVLIETASYFMQLNGNEELFSRMSDVMLNTLKYYSIIIIDDDTDVACDTVEEMFENRITPVLNLNVKSRQVESEIINLDDLFGANNEDTEEDTEEEYTEDDDPFGYNNNDDVPF
jgi:hypothetical protein